MLTCDWCEDEPSALAITNDLGGWDKIGLKCQAEMLAQIMDEYKAKLVREEQEDALRRGLKSHLAVGR